MSQFDAWLKSSATTDFEFDDFTALSNARQSYAVRPRTEFEQYLTAEIVVRDDKVDYAQFVQEQAAEEMAEKSITSSLRFAARKYGLRRLGYAIPYVGYAFLAYDLYQFGKYLAEH